MTEINRDFGCDYQIQEGEFLNLFQYNLEDGYEHNIQPVSTVCLLYTSVFTRQMLLDRLWADDLEVEDRIVDSHIKNIRKKLNADYIKTIRGVGYRIDKEN